MYRNSLALTSNRRTLLFVCVAAILIFLWLHTTIVFGGNYGWGGYSSSKTVKMNGIADSQLTVNMQGISESQIDVAMGARPVTLVASGVIMDAGGTHATLNGQIAAFGLAPTVDYWWQWGYDTSYGNTTAIVTTAAVGSFSAVINHYNPDATVHFRFVTDNQDGTTYGADQTFLMSAGNQTPTFTMVKIIPFIWLALCIFAAFMVFMAGEGMVTSIVIAAIIVLVGVAGLIIMIAQQSGLW